VLSEPPPARLEETRAGPVERASHAEPDAAARALIARPLVLCSLHASTRQPDPAGFGAPATVPRSFNPDGMPRKTGPSVIRMGAIARSRLTLVWHSQRGCTDQKRPSFRVRASTSWIAPWVLSLRPGGATANVRKTRCEAGSSVIFEFLAAPNPVFEERSLAGVKVPACSSRASSKRRPTAHKRLPDQMLSASCRPGNRPAFAGPGG
jgi:hypothetical protein